MRASRLPLEAIIGSRALGERAGWTQRGNRDLKCSVRVEETNNNSSYSNLKLLGLLIGCLF